jgi:hypothetical protein
MKMITIVMPAKKDLALLAGADWLVDATEAIALSVG